MNKAILAIAAMAFLGSSSSATAYVVNYVDGPLQNTAEIEQWDTYATDMDGMTVDITYGDGSTVSHTWATTGAGTGGLPSWTGGSFELSGSSYSNEWHLSITDQNIEIASILIDAGAGDAVFDVWEKPPVGAVNPDYEGTANSKYGDPFDPWLNGDADPTNIITATYSGAVGIGGAAPVGDLYRYLQIDFAAGSYFSSTDTLSFYADTDNVKGGVNPVPEPSTLLLMGLGMAGLAGYSRKRKQ